MSEHLTSSPSLATTTAPATGQPLGWSVFWPLVILELSILLLFSYQWVLLSAQASAIERQMLQQEQIAEQAKMAESKATQILLDLLALAATDEQAKAIVDKHRIQHQPSTGAAAPAANPAPAASPAPAPAPPTPAR